MALQFSLKFGRIFWASILLLILLNLSVVLADDEDEGDILNNDEGIGRGQSTKMDGSGSDHLADFVTSSSPPPLQQLSHSSPMATRLQEHQAQQLFSLAKKFQLVCCMGGVPQLSHPELVRNFTFQSVSYVVDRDGEGGVLEPAGCRLFKGSFLLPQPSLLFGVSVELSYAAHVVCKCPEMGMGHALDRSCRRLPNCQNNGFRSLLDPRRCFCLEPFFGEQCQKLCDRGRRMRGTDGRDYCNCSPFFRGDECRQPICLNGGHPLSDESGCECPPHFLGFHCEIDANRSSSQQQKFGRDHENAFVGAGTSRFHQSFGPEQQGNEMFSRDVSGTVFSLVMIVVLVLSMYMLMKHRMQVQTRYLSNRRADLLGACAFPTSGIGGGQPTAMSTVGTNTGMAAALAPGHARRVELFPICGGVDQTPAPNGGRAFPPFVRALAPFFGADAGPPPYAPPGQRVRRSRNEVLPPLPSYEDATKLPALRPATLVVEQSVAEEGVTEENGQSQQQQRGEGNLTPQQRMGQIIVEEAELAADRNGSTETREEGGGIGIGTRTLLTSRMAVGSIEEEDLVMLEMEERGGRNDVEDWRRRDGQNGQNVDENSQRLEAVAQNGNK